MSNDEIKKETLIDYNIYILPALVITTITGIMYVAGILNIMLLAAIVLLSLGIFLFIYSFSSLSKKFSFSRKSCIPLLFIVLTLVYCMWYLWDGVYADGDTMNHWAVIVREMINDNRLPNFANTSIACQSYPPATACWIYYFDLIVGYSEMNSLIAQVMWIIFSATTLFSLNKKRYIVVDLLIEVVIVYLVQFTSCSIDSLKVDSLLGVVTLAAIVTVKNIQEKDWWVILGYIVTITMIKNSGLLLSLFVVACYYTVAKITNTDVKNTKVRSAVMSAVAISTFYLWQRHIALVYEQASATRHGLRLGSMKGIFDARTPDEIKSLIINFFVKWFSFNSGSSEWLIIILISVLAISCIVLNNLKKNIVKAVYICNLLAYIVYKIGLLGMYLFNMPGQEAVEIAEYVRYQETIDIVIILSAIYFIYELVDMADVKIRKLLLGVVVVICCLCAYVNVDRIFTRPDYVNGGLHRKIYSLINQSNTGIEYGDKALAYNSWNLHITTISYSVNNYESKVTYDVSDLQEALDSNSNDYDCIIISTIDSEVVNFLKDNGFSEETFIIELK